MTTLTAHPKSKSKLEALKAFMIALNIKFEEEKDNYDPEFVAKIKDSQREITEGKGVTVTFDDIWKD